MLTPPEKRNLLKYLLYFSFSKGQTLKRLITLFLLIQFSGCSEKPSNHPIFKYYPPDDVFEEGYVSKFYTHYLPKNTDETKRTRITYSEYRKLSESSYAARIYDAGFGLTRVKFYSIDGSSLRLDSAIRIRRVDTTIADIRKPVVLDFADTMDAVYEEVFLSNGRSYIDEDTQIAVNDTFMLEVPGKVFKSRVVIKDLEKDSIVNQYLNESYYLEGFGFSGSKQTYDEAIYETELIEQMSISEFKRRADHSKHRVAWIDPENTISDDSDFQICDHEKNIADYYNSTPDGRYIHSKRAMLDTIYANLDKSKLFDKSGRLVFRFVVNCEGKAGRFIAKGYDMDYQPMEFHQETVNHLFEILQKLEEWRPVVLRNEARDAYFYTTFNIENGEIINILP